MTRYQGFFQITPPAFLERRDPVELWVLVEVEVERQLMSFDKKSPKRTGQMLNFVLLMLKSHKHAVGVNLQNNKQWIFLVKLVLKIR